MPGWNDSFFALTVAGLSRRLRAREFTDADMLRAFAKRVEERGASFVAVSLRGDAISDAKMVDRELRSGRTRGPLQGIPFGVSDLISVANQPTAYGSKHFARQVFSNDAVVVERLQRARAIAIAKLVTGELGSAESGVGEAVATGALPVAIGVDSAGVLLADCVRRGVVALVTTTGLVSRSGIAAVTWTLDRVAIVTRASDDCGHVLAAAAGDDGSDPLALGKGFHYAPQFTRPVAELSITVIGGGAAAGIPSRLGTRGAAAAWTDLPSIEVARVIADAEGASTFDDLAGGGHYEAVTDRALAERLEAGANLRTVDYLRAMRVRRLVGEYFAGLFRDADAIVCEARGPLGNSTIAAAALAGLPVLLLPAPAGSARSEPILLIGKPLGENVLLKLGAAYEGPKVS